MRHLIQAAIVAAALTTPVLAQETQGFVPRPSAHELDRDELTAWLDGIVPYAIKAGDIAGAVVTVVADGEVVALEGYGYANVEERRPVDPQRTLFRPGSISKLLTWTAVMQQVERGMLDLNADINSYLDFVIPPLGGEPITLRHILTHTAGFEEQIKHVLAYEAGEQPPFEDILRTLVPARIYAPGTTPAYSNYATALAGYIVQRVSGEPFHEYVAENIFEPLGMEDATFSQDLSRSQRANLSSGYVTASGEAQQFELIGTPPAGAMSATAPDMARFMLAHLNEGQLGDAQILQPDTARLMHRQALASIPALNGMALGFYESSINGHRVISHGGDTAAFHSDLHLFIDEGVGLFISLNSTGENGAAHKLRALLFSEFADRYFPGEVKALPDDLASENATRLGGQWTSSRRSATNFLSLTELLSPITLTTTEDGKLTGTNLPILGAPVHDWVEVEPFVWQASNSHERLAATVVDGTPTRFSLNTFAPVMVFEPVPWQRSVTWLLPALALSLAALAGTVVQWPAAALVRRRYGTASQLAGTVRAIYRAVRVSALLMLGALVGWFALITAMLSNFALLGTRTDVLLFTLQCMTIGASLALGASAVANAFYAFHGGRSVWSKLWSVVLLLATVIVIWVAVAFNLFKIGISY